MLQQTRVETVLAYYEPFLQRFPDVHALARADEQAVLKQWEGLGYYRRALNLHRGAQQLAEAGGTLPDCAAAWAEVAGVGPYVAAAIASIALGEAVAAVDGNVARVIARLFAEPADVRQPAGRRRVGALATQLLAPRRPGDFNQAWMDLGSAVCTPRSPKCGECPLAKSCAAAASDDPTRWPVRAARKAVPQREVVAVLFARGERFLVRRRPSTGLWAGLWELPWVELADGTAPGRAVRALADALGVHAVGRLGRPVRHTHQLTHRLLRYRAYHVAVAAAEEGGPAGETRWVTRDEWSALSRPTVQRRLVELLTSGAARA